MNYAFEPNNCCVREFIAGTMLLVSSGISSGLFQFLLAAPSCGDLAGYCDSRRLPRRGHNPTIRESAVWLYEAAIWNFPPSSRATRRFPDAHNLPLRAAGKWCDIQPAVL